MEIKNGWGTQGKGKDRRAKLNKVELQKKRQKETKKTPKKEGKCYTGNT